MTKEILTYNGEVTFGIINDLLADYKLHVKNCDVDTVVAKRIYAILVEGLENTLRHKCKVASDAKHSPVEVLVSKDEDIITIEICNYLSNVSIDSISDKIELINSLDLVGLNRLYRASISKARISDKGGAGLGLIEIGRNSRYNLQYELNKEYSDISFFRFVITISNNPNKVKTI